MEDKYYVIAIDKFLSGWGQAEGGKSIIVIECQDAEQQYECEKAMSYDKGLKNIRTHYGKKPVIRNAAHIQYMNFLECPRWNQDYMFHHKFKNESKNNNMKRTINEAQLRAIIAEAVDNVLNSQDAPLDENEMEEGWLGDKFNQARSAASSFAGARKPADSNQSLGNRFAAAKKSWQNQGEVNNLQNLLNQLSQFVDNGEIDPNTTLAQLLGGKYNNNKFGKLTGQLNNRRSQITKRGGKVY